MSRKYYVKNEIVPFEEDGTHEFKGHRSISSDQLPPWTQGMKQNERPTRRAVSRTINAFLNTGTGGTVYLGVLDSGEVKGIQLTEHQKDHVLHTMSDLMSRYNPPVKPHRYRIKFVPVVGSVEEGAIFQANQLNCQEMDAGMKQKEHTVQTHTFCWCDVDSTEQCNAGVLPTQYVIEIRVRAWDPEDPRNAGDGYGSVINVHPVHEDEQGQCYFRQQASLIQYNVTELARMTRHEVQTLCEQKLDSLKKEIAMLEHRKAQLGNG